MAPLNPSTLNPGLSIPEDGYSRIASSRTWAVDIGSLGRGSTGRAAGLQGDRAGRTRARRAGGRGVGARAGQAAHLRGIRRRRRHHASRHGRVARARHPGGPHPGGESPPASRRRSYRGLWRHAREGGGTILLESHLQALGSAATPSPWSEKLARDPGDATRATRLGRRLPGDLCQATRTGRRGPRARSLPRDPSHATTPTRPLPALSKRVVAIAWHPWCGNCRSSPDRIDEETR